MKATLTVLVATIAAISLLSWPACAARKEAPDPIKVQEEIAELFDWDILDPIRVKGKSEPISVAVLKAMKPRIGMHLPDIDASDPLVGRNEEVAKLGALMDQALAGKGQIVSIIGEAGLGKSRLVAKAFSMAQARGFSIYGGEAESHGVNSSYLVWHPIWRNIFGLDPTWETAAQLQVLERRIAELDRNMTPRGTSPTKDAVALSPLGP